MTIYSNDQYYQAKLQLRPCTKEILDFVYNEIDKRDDCLISKEEELKTGADIYLTSQKFAQILGRKLKVKFKGKVTISRTLFGINKMTSKKVYRVTILFRLEEKNSN
ncbi:hypothetical protein HYT57_05525 [Candidatus Woesearchaeota archaeon]|nr:hypothetical protein [Candidatus Woesearchaeota archaeon]